jgi:hypothetical protein
LKKEGSFERKGEQQKGIQPFEREIVVNIDAMIFEFCKTI